RLGAAGRSPSGIGVRTDSPDRLAVERMPYPGPEGRLTIARRCSAGKSGNYGQVPEGRLKPLCTLFRAGESADTLKTSPSGGDRTTLPPIVNAQEITKAFAANPLFQNVSFTISDGNRIGLIGPNGSGKSTLLRILAGEVATDSGEVSFRKRTRLACVEQDSRFQPGSTIRAVIESALDRC